MDGIKIYRGSDQIGGIVTEITKGDHRILIDLGADLPGTKNPALSDDELIKRVFAGEGDTIHTDAVLFTHYHGDHVGLRGKAPEGIPMYIGGTAKEIMETIAMRVDLLNKKLCKNAPSQMETINRMEPYWKLGSSRDFSGIKVTPPVCDHSAIDSYMFVIELNGKKILYTGDFRDHGIPGQDTFESMIKRYVGKIDVLVTEGTMISRLEETGNNPIKSEDDLGKRASEIFAEHKENVVLVSSTNLDSVMEFYHATPADKVFLCDAYQAEVMNIAIKSRSRFFDKYRYKKCIYVLCPDNNSFYMKNLEGVRNPVTKRRCFEMANEDIYLDKGFVMLARPNNNPNMAVGRFEERMKKMKDPFITYSMWTGYLEDGKAPDANIVRFLEGKNDKAHMEILHTSGHAYVETIAKLMELTNPDKIIPMHTEGRDAFTNLPQFGEYANRIWKKEDGQVYEF